MITCARQLLEITQQHTIILDSGWRILNEYKSNLNQSGQPGVGDAFCKWALTNWANPQRCELVAVTEIDDASHWRTFVEFPDDPELQRFDPSDRKFVAVALAHGETPPILNAVDTDWWEHRSALSRHGVQIQFLCPDAMPG
ncbi:MAG: hypothetical protein R2911_34345 [Caldilineaceae bacterium]